VLTPFSRLRPSGSVGDTTVGCSAGDACGCWWTACLVCTTLLGGNGVAGGPD
jgi:hypothetical protein